MKKQEIDNEQSKKVVYFPNGNKAKMVTAKIGKSPKAVLKALEIRQPKALFMIIGGAADFDKALQSDETLKLRLVQLFSRGIARTAAKVGALIMDGGTHAGVMAMMGEGIADQERKSVLLGVAPSGKVTYPKGPAEGSVEDSAPLDPNHSHFVLVKSDKWGGETQTMFELAEALINRTLKSPPPEGAADKHSKANKSPKSIPAVAILINGGAIAKDEVLRCVRNRWPIIVIEGSGRLADEIAKLWRVRERREKKKKKIPFIGDPIMAEIIAEGNLHLFSINDSIESFEQLILQELPTDVDPTLKLAWERFALYDSNAVQQQTNFNKQQHLILRLGVYATLFVLIHAKFEGFFGSYPPLNKLLINKLLEYLIVLIPITISVLVAAANRFREGNKWVLLRSGAEAIKREIYRYRTRAEDYRDQPVKHISREERLVRNVEVISRQLMQTEVNLSALQPYEGTIPPKMYGAASKDNGFKVLTPEEYVAGRLFDQLNYYRLKTTRLERHLKQLHWLIYIFGGAGTFLAAIGLQLWVALTTALVGALTAYLGYQQLENTLMKYNQAATNLANIEAWWTALSEKEKANSENIDSLVRHTEEVLEGELTGWVQQMKDALAELRAQQTAETSGAESQQF